MCPECAQGKHQNCTIYVLDRDDNLVPCECHRRHHDDSVLNRKEAP